MPGPRLAPVALGLLLLACHAGGAARVAELRVRFSLREHVDLVSYHAHDSAAWVFDALGPACTPFSASPSDDGQSVVFRAAGCSLGAGRAEEALHASVGAFGPTVPPKLSEGLASTTVTHAANATLDEEPLEATLGRAYAFSSLAESVFEVSHRRCLPAENNPCPPTSRASCWVHRRSLAPICRCGGGTELAAGQPDCKYRPSVSLLGLPRLPTLDEIEAGRVVAEYAPVPAQGTASVARSTAAYPGGGSTCAVAASAFAFDPLMGTAKLEVAPVVLGTAGPSPLSPEQLFVVSKAVNASDPKAGAEYAQALGALQASLLPCAPEYSRAGEVAAGDCARSALFAWLSARGELGTAVFERAPASPGHLAAAGRQPGPRAELSGFAGHSLDGGGLIARSLFDVPLDAHLDFSRSPVPAEVTVFTTYVSAHHGANTTGPLLCSVATTATLPSRLAPAGERGLSPARPSVTSFSLYKVFSESSFVYYARVRISVPSGLGLAQGLADGVDLSSVRVSRGESQFEAGDVIPVCGSPEFAGTPWEHMQADPSTPETLGQECATPRKLCTPEIFSATDSQTRSVWVAVPVPAGLFRANEVAHELAEGRGRARTQTFVCEHGDRLMLDGLLAFAGGAGHSRGVHLFRMQHNVRICGMLVRTECAEAYITPGFVSSGNTELLLTVGSTADARSFNSSVTTVSRALIGSAAAGDHRASSESMSSIENLPNSISSSVMTLVARSESLNPRVRYRITDLYTIHFLDKFKYKVVIEALKAYSPAAGEPVVPQSVLDMCPERLVRGYLSCAVRRDTHDSLARNDTVVDVDAFVHGNVDIGLAEETLFGVGDFAEDYAVAFAQVLRERFQLNGGNSRAWFVSPRFDWSAASVFALGIPMYAISANLITVAALDVLMDGDKPPVRRLLVAAHAPPSPPQPQPGRSLLFNLRPVTQLEHQDVFMLKMLGVDLWKSVLVDAKMDVHSAGAQFFMGKLLRETLCSTKLHFVKLALEVAISQAIPHFTKGIERVLVPFVTFDTKDGAMVADGAWGCGDAGLGAKVKEIDLRLILLTAGPSAISAWEIDTKIGEALTGLSFYQGPTAAISILPA